MSPASTARHRPCQRPGHVLIFGIAALCLLLAFASLAIDFGLRVAVDAETQAAADAAARAGVERLSELQTAMDDDQAVANAVEVRAAAVAGERENATAADGARLRAADVEVGTWDDDARTFTPGEVVGINAVRVTLERSAARGNAVRTTIGAAIGVDHLTSKRSAVARLETPPRYGLVGLDSFRSVGALVVDGAPLWRRGSIASNGDVSLNLLGVAGVTLIDGHVATSGNVRLPWLVNLTLIRGGIVRPARPFVLPPVSVEAPTKVNDNHCSGGLIGGTGDLVVVGFGDIGPGVYCVDDLVILAGAILRVRGPATIYVRGNVTILGSVLSLSSDPGALRVRVAGNGPVTIAANVTLAADVYAPQSNAIVAAGVSYTGRLIARRIDVLGAGLFFLRPDLPPPALGRSRIALVR